ncbi:MAG: hypothetical protein IJ842_02440 [Bacilli bacterium]|nr:hypothetical protein [Bacilli bacterium]
MKKNLKGIIFLGLSLLCIIIGVILINKSLMEYAIFLFTVAFVLAVFGIGNFIYGNDPVKVYESTVKRILNTYDSILVKSSSVPRLDGKNVILVETIDDLVDAQLEIRKPICYLKQTESCSFVLLDEKEAYVYVEKVNDDVTSPIEIEIRESRIRGKNIEEMDAEMLRDIERTTIVKLSNKKSYKVSPIRKLDELQNKQEVSSAEKENDEIKSDISNTSNEVFDDTSKEVETTEDVQTPEVSSISSNVDSEIL